MLTVAPSVQENEERGEESRDKKESTEVECVSHIGPLNKMVHSPSRRGPNDATRSETGGCQHSVEGRLCQVAAALGHGWRMGHGFPGRSDV